MCKLLKNVQLNEFGNFFISSKVRSFWTYSWSKANKMPYCLFNTFLAKGLCAPSECPDGKCPAAGDMPAGECDRWKTCLYLDDKHKL